MRVVWTSGALADVDQIQDYVAQDRPIAAHQLARALIGRTNSLLAETRLQAVEDAPWKRVSWS